MDKDNKNVTTVSIFGENIELIASESEDYIHNLARYINKRMSAIQRTSRCVAASANMMKTLTVINIADDYYKEKTINSQLNQTVELYSAEISSLSQRLNSLSEENAALTEALKEKTAQEEAVRRELNEFLENFGRMDDKIKRIQ